MNIRGKVTNATSGAPIGGAKLDIFDGETSIAGLTSSADGGFEFSTQTDYTGHLLKILVSKKGFEPLTHILRAEDEAEVPLQLKEQSIQPQDEAAGPQPSKETKFPVLTPLQWMVVAVFVVVAGLIAWLATRPGAAPSVVSFGASPDVITSGSTSTLAWKVEGVDHVQISPSLGSVIASGQEPVTPFQTTSYTLLASNAAGSTTVVAMVKVEPRPTKPRVLLFAAKPENIPSGSGSTLAWKVVDAQTVEIWPGIGLVGSLGEKPVKPLETTTYTLLASNVAGTMKSLATVQVEPPPSKPRVLSFMATPETIRRGGRSTLSWNVRDAQTVSISPDIGAVRPTGESVVAPSQTTKYTLVAGNAAGSMTAQVTVQIVPLVIFPKERIPILRKETLSPK